MVVPLITGALSAIGSFLSSAGPVIARFATSLAQKLPAILDVFTKVAEVAGAVAQLCGVLKPGDDVEKLGAKACQAEKNQDEFEESEAYINYLRNEVELDQVAFAKRGDAERMAHMASGVAIASKGIEDKSGVEISPDFWAQTGKISLSAAEIGKMIDACGKSGSVSGVVDYFGGNSDLSERLQAGEIIKGAIAEVHPDWPTSKIDDRIQDMCAKIRNNNWK